MFVKEPSEVVCEHDACSLPPSRNVKRDSLIGESRRTNSEATSIKGRIVVFSISGCPHCRATKNLLHENRLPFVEINLDVYPERRSELVDRTQLRTVPQIFFNEVSPRPTIHTICVFVWVNYLSIY